MTTENTYNGWSNYETWRVGLEVFDGWSIACCFEEDRWRELLAEFTLEASKRAKILEGAHQDLLATFFHQEAVLFLADYMAEYPRSMIEEVECNMVQGWLDAFLNKVRFRELAEHHLEEDEIFTAWKKNLERGVK